MKLQVDSNFKQPKMKLQVVFNFKRVWNEATSSFQLRTSSKFMNQAGRSQLNNFVIFGLHGHCSSFIFLPITILKRIQSLITRFLWRGSSIGPCFYKVSWK